MTRKPHIAYVCADRGVPVGGHKGASLHVAELVRALTARGAAVDILAARVAEGAGATLSGANIHDVGGSRPARHAREALARSASAASSPADAGEATAVLLNQEMGKALERLHKQRGIDVIYERYSLWSFAAAGFARAQGIPLLLEVNAPLRDEQRRYRSLANEALAASLEHYMFASAARVLVPSELLVPYVVAHGAARKAVRVVPNAADPRRFRRGRRAGTRADGPDGAQFVVGFVGSLKPWHGLQELARAFRRLHRSYRGYRLLVVGEGPLRAEMEAELRRYGLADAVTFTGAADHDAVPTWMARMDVAVAPYPADAPSYFSPIKIFEYMAGGVPIVASRTGQIATVLRHRQTALLHRPGAIAEMTAAIDELRRRPALAAKLARQARALAVRRYTWTKNAAAVLALVRYTKAAERGKRRAPAPAAGRQGKTPPGMSRRKAIPGNGPLRERAARKKTPPTTRRTRQAPR